MIPGKSTLLYVLWFYFDWGENKEERSNCPELVLPLPVKEKNIGLELLQCGNISELLFKWYIPITLTISDSSVSALVFGQPYRELIYWRAELGGKRTEGGRKGRVCPSLGSLR